MISRFARTKVKGVTLLEVLLAGFLGSLVISGVSGVFINVMRLSEQESKKLLLRQSVSQALRFIQEDMRRAGYAVSSLGRDNIQETTPLMLKGADAVVHIDGSEVSYLYYQGGQVVYSAFRARQGKLTYCAQRGEVIPAVGQCPRFYSLFDERIIKLKELRVFYLEEEGPLISLSIEAAYHDASHQLRLSTLVAVRNHLRGER